MLIMFLDLQGDGFFGLVNLWYSFIPHFFLPEAAFGVSVGFGVVANDAAMLDAGPSEVPKSAADLNWITFRLQVESRAAWPYCERFVQAQREPPSERLRRLSPGRVLAGAAVDHVDQIRPSCRRFSSDLDPCPTTRRGWARARPRGDSADWLLATHHVDPFVFAA
jgi:hypothetical protein